MDRIDLNTLPPHAFVIMTIYFLQTLKILPYLDDEIQFEKDDIKDSIESDNFDYNVFEMKQKSYVFI